MVDITRVSKEAIDSPRLIRVFNAQDYQRAQFERSTKIIDARR